VQLCVAAGFVAASQRLSATVAPVEATQVTGRLCEPLKEHSPQLPEVQE
jgi:hypothetical protein